MSSLKTDVQAALGIYQRHQPLIARQNQAVSLGIACKAFTPSASASCKWSGNLTPEAIRAIKGAIDRRGEVLYPTKSAAESFGARMIPPGTLT